MNMKMNMIKSLMITNKSQIPKLILLLTFLTLLTLIPFISTTMRSTYLYFLLNLLILVLAIEAGFVSSLHPNPARDTHKKVALPLPPLPSFSAPSSILINQTPPPLQSPLITTSTTTTTTSIKMERSSSSANIRPMMKRCKSRPSLFFIGGLEDEESYAYEEEEEEEKEEVTKEVEVESKRRMTSSMVAEVERDYEMMVMSKQELFMKAELFIGNFYKQLKMQKERSWNKLHGFVYHHKD